MAGLARADATGHGYPSAMLDDLLSLALFFGGWWLLQRFVLPRAGVSG
jgi:hypothetical protein